MAAVGLLVVFVGICLHVLGKVSDQIFDFFHQVDWVIFLLDYFVLEGIDEESFLMNLIEVFVFGDLVAAHGEEFALSERLCT